MSTRAWGPVLVVLVAAVFFAPELVGDRVAATTSLDRWRPWAELATGEKQSTPSHNPDCLTSYYPRRHVLHEAFREGEPPFWNPDAFCGAPFLADPQAEVLYAPNVALAPLDPRTQLGWFLFLHVAWGGLGAFALLRRHDIPIAIAVAGGAAFALNGWFVKHFGQPPFLATAAWVPWILVLAMDAKRSPTPRRAALLGIGAAMMFLAGQPQVALQAGYATALVLLTRLLIRDRDAEGPLRSGALVATGAFAAGIALLLVTPQLLPTLDLASRSARAELPYETVISGAFHPVDLVRLVVPEFFGTPITGDEWSPLFLRGDGFYLRTQLNSVFAGAPVFVLALLGMVGPRTRRAALPFTVLFVVSTLVAFATPLARVAHGLPGFAFSRIDRVGHLIVLAQLVPAGLAAAQLVKGAGVGRRMLGVLVIFAALAGGIAVGRIGEELPALLGGDTMRLPGGVLPPETLERTIARTWTAAAFIAATGIALLLPASRWTAAAPFGLAIVQLFLFASPYRGDRRPEEVFPPDAPGISALREVLEEPGTPAGAGGFRFVRFGRDHPVRPYALSSVLPPSTNVPYDLPDTQGYNALCDRRLGDALSAATGENLFTHGIWTGRRIVAPTRSTSLEHPIFDALSVRAAVGMTPLAADGWTARASRGFRIWRNEEALPRVRIAPTGSGVGPEELEARLRSGDLDPAAEVLWVGDGVHGEPGEDLRAEVGLEEDSRNRLVLRTSTDRDAVLVVADSDAPGWHARVDGKSQEILSAWGVARAVLLPAGEHRVEMSYVPPGFRLGLALSAIGLLLAAVAFLRD